MTDQPDGVDNFESLSFEEALRRLESIVDEIEEGDVDLERAIQAYEQGVRLREHCERKLQEAQERIRRIEVGPDGRPEAVSHEVE